MTKTETYVPAETAPTEEEIAAATMAALKGKLKKFAIIGAATVAGAVVLGVVVAKLRDKDLPAIETIIE